MPQIDYIPVFRALFTAIETTAPPATVTDTVFAVLSTDLTYSGYLGRYGRVLIGKF